MYKDRDCVGRKTKYNNAWLKEELIEKCQKLDVPYTKRMTKKQLCDALNEADDVPAVKNKSDNPCSMPRDVRFSILMNLPITDVTQLCQANKDCAKICQDEEFWKRRYLNQYKVYDKPDNMTWKKWYKKIFNSGDLVVLDTNTKNLIDLKAYNVV